MAITNVQANDAGIYEFVLYGDRIIGPKNVPSIQTTNGPGVFQKPKCLATNFICDFAGATGRIYKILRSTNLLTCGDLVTLPDLTGTITFTNPPASVRAQFYRSSLLP